MKLGLTKAAVLLAFLPALAFNVLVDAQRGGRGVPAAPPTPRAAAPFDLSGQWVSLITEDWRQRQFTPAKGDYVPLPLSPAARKIADSWDPAKDEAAGEQCKAYGAAGLMRLPTRIRIAWEDDTTLKLEADAGTQTRMFKFDAPALPSKGEPTWQGTSTAQWDLQPGGRGANAGAPRRGSLKVVTANLKSGYLRKNGVPYSEDAKLTEYFDVIRTRNGDVLLMVTSIVDDPKYLRQPFIVTTQFKKQSDAKGWDPTPCSATW